MLQAGKLRHRWELQSASESQDTFGEAIQTWSTYDTVWGREEPLRGRELLLAQQVNAEMTTKLTIRYNSTVTPQHRAVRDSRTLEIVSIANPEGKNEYLELLCKEIV